MSSPQISSGNRAMQLYTLVPNLHVQDPAIREIDLGNCPWTVATVIEDDDLMFGGKALSAWYEEDRRRLSTSHEEEERRGRQRERVRTESHHHHHHQHVKKSKESKQ
ncbi:hypothetical protein B0T17DRAFT_621254 [Bombardia bombarda]|uniref:Uncharacterized protein n=1 Tax=Bombardia bombarda TaxID=252184 RepID=A0AA39TJX3_9PEZI|nr:hypothetical protein B0T17DRAFT_621254 [Bombardia bombarda]